MNSPFKTSNQPGKYTVKGLVTEDDIMAMALKLVNRRLGKRRSLKSPDEVRAHLSVKMGTVEHEEFSVIFLNNRHCVLSYETLFRGTIDGASVYPREVVKMTLKFNAAAVLLVHNHPSGDPKPSQSDIQITKRLKEALGLIDVRVLDHFIVGGDMLYQWPKRVFYKRPNRPMMVIVASKSSYSLHYRSIQIT